MSIDDRAKLPRPEVSIVVPVHNEAPGLHALAERLRWLMDQLDGYTEVILVDDGSTDSSLGLMREIHEQDARFNVVSLSRNFGHQAALSAGLDLSRGAAVVTMDADLQHPVEIVPEMVARWRKGYDVVYGVMRTRPTEGRFKRLSSDSFYRLLNKLAHTPMAANAGDFRLMDRRVVDVLRLMPERNRYLRGMSAWIGFQQVGIPYDCEPRFAGRSNYTLSRMLGLALNAIVGFSLVPLRFALAAGAVASLCGMGLGVFTVVARLTQATVPGWATMVVVTSFLGGINLMVLGVVGEYIGRIYDEVRQRPLYLISAINDAAAAPLAPSSKSVRAEDAARCL